MEYLSKGNFYRVSGGCENPADRDDGLFFVETIPEEEDELFQVHSVVHEDLNPLSDTDLDVFEHTEETTQKKTPNAHHSIGSENTRENCPIDTEPRQPPIEDGITRAKPIPDTLEIIRPPTAIDNGLVGEIGAPEDIEEQTTTGGEKLNSSCSSSGNPQDNISPEQEPIKTDARQVTSDHVVADGDRTETVGIMRSEQRTILSPRASHSALEESRKFDSFETATRRVGDPNNDPGRGGNTAAVTCDQVERTESVKRVSTPKKSTSTQDRPLTLPLGDQAHQLAAREESAVVKKRQGLQKQFALNQVTPDGAVAFEQIFKKVQIKPALTPMFVFVPFVDLIVTAIDCNLSELSYAQTEADVSLKHRVSHDALFTSPAK